MSEKTTADIVGRRDRATDKQVTARIGSFFMRWQWVLWVMTWLFLALGFDFKKPSQKFSDLELGQTKLELRVSRVESRGDTVMSILRGLAIDACDRLKGNYYARDKLMCGQN